MGNHHGLVKDNLGHFMMLGPRCEGGNEGRLPRLINQAMDAVRAEAVEAVKAVYRKKVEAEKEEGELTEDNEDDGEAAGDKKEEV